MGADNTLEIGQEKANKMGKIVTRNDSHCCILIAKYRHWGDLFSVPVTLAMMSLNANGVNAS